jgi:Zn ribbon nucleic-acid-binding protein
MVQAFCPKCSCDAASVLSFATEDGCFTASVQCHVCGFEKNTDSFLDEQTAREAATLSWVSGSDPIASSQRG